MNFKRVTKWIVCLILIIISTVSMLVVQAQQAPPAFSKQSPPNGATNVGTTLTLRWDKVTGTQKYCVSTTPSCPNADAGYTTVTGNSITLNVQPNTTYYWQIRIYNGSVFTPANGTGGWWSFKTMPAVSKVSPGNGATAQPTNPTLRWGALPAGTFVRYCVSSTTSCPQGDAGYISVPGAATSVQISVPASSTRYWQVRYYDSYGNFSPANGPGAFWSFRTIDAPPSDFQKVSPGNGQQIPFGITLKWTTAIGAEYYRVNYSCTNLTYNVPCGNGAFNVAGTQASLAYSSNSRFNWQITACNQLGCTVADRLTKFPNSGAWAFYTPK